MKDELKHISKILSLVLRHQPEYLNIKLDKSGWADVAEIMDAMNRKGIVVNQTIIEEVVTLNDKQRFVLNEDHSRIRANQGHSVEVDLELKPVAPPDVLFHGTTDIFLDSIYSTGLQKQNRHHVHLSENIQTALSVGSRRGKPVLIKIDAAAMHRAGFSFYLSANGVWLTDEVPVGYLSLCD
jgi:putative RNA 2'-phosphotransferase